MTIYEQVGGELFFVDLVKRFYQGVENDPRLRPQYPADLEPGKRHLYLFLVQYFGGPSTYSEERGHPRLRARHLPFQIGIVERDAWVEHMAASLQQADIDSEVKLAMLKYFEDAASFLINH
jgi:hemoglobin